MIRKIWTLKWLFITSVLFCSCNNEVYITEDLYTGMTIEEYKLIAKDHIRTYTISINEIQCDVEPIFCNRKLEGVSFKTDRRQELLEILREKMNKLNRFKIDEAILRSSFDLLVSFDTVIYVISPNVIYIKEESALICK